ncbi:sporulation integral membrane protein YlbJ [Clostridium sp.]|uniref:sporulation integral membrane protein YlbJ n=1 Tax=Clostridium sp. TaxID=1506 RepID=UPI003F346852
MYSLLFLWLFIFILIAILLKLLNIKKHYIMCFCITFLIILFTLNMESCIKAAIEGSELVVKAILPTIFPFSVICNLLISYDGISLYSKFMGPLFCKPLGLSKNCSFPLAASFLCGYPLGAKYSSDIYSLGYINKNEYERLLNIASNAGPIFLIGSVGAAMLGSTKYGYILLIGNYLSAIIVGFLTKYKSRNSSFSPLVTPKFKSVNFGTSLKSAIENAISTTLNISAFVIIFSIIISIIKNNAFISIAFRDIEQAINLPNSSLYNFFLANIEFTNGCNLIANSTLSINLKLSLISFVCSFSSLSILAQVSSVVSKNSPPMKKYVFWKFIQGIISFCITFISSKILLVSTPTTNIQAVGNVFINYYKFTLPIILILSFTLILKILSNEIRKLHTS